MENEIYETIATVDPITKFTKNTILRITSKCFTLQSMQGSHGETYLNSFEGTALAISFRDDNGHHTTGSATIVGPGVAISAKHVIEEWLDDITQSDTAIVGQGVSKIGLELWNIEKVTLLDSTDLAILSIKRCSELPDNLEIYTTHITTRTPAIGDKVLLTGFSADRRTATAHDPLGINVTLRLCHGEVVEVWHKGRDRIMLPGPSFAVNCPAFGGMSGGAVFDHHGHLTGIVSSSMEGDEIAYVSHIWPALVTKFEPTWPRISNSTYLLSMGAKKCVRIHRPDAFTPDIKEGQFAITYTPWS
ncbi:trypsin-like peptidase domain-containing protein [Acidovorax sp. Root219]|uniref:trypsin-like peptidase domain-containing protein n=1 Tax=Acidovorax sp. Root219 TaxID=1736493 RepID=UPI000B06DB10|nr:trypsin-like peptidase domain-containing protein [Acidovorax sp. Root219]